MPIGPSSKFRSPLSEEIPRARFQKSLWPTLGDDGNSDSGDKGCQEIFFLYWSKGNPSNQDPTRAVPIIAPMMHPKIPSLRPRTI